MKKKLLICGATGFIGRNLLEHYSKLNTYDIKATYNIRTPFETENYVEWIRCDLRESNEVKNALKDVDIIMQFAATTSGAKDILSKPYIHVTDNSIMNSIIFREAFEQNIEHLIFPSCSIMYQNSELPLRETDYNPSDDINPIYFGAGHTKVYLENMCKFYSNFKKTKFTVIRHTNIYGPHDKYDLEKSHVFAATITKVFSSNDFINVWGEGLEKRDLLYVDDLINFIDLALKKQNNYFELYNCALGKAIRIRDLVELIVKNSGIILDIRYDLTKKSIPTSLSLDCSKAFKELGWTPNYTLEQGIIKTISWYKKWIKKN
jgi:nucleoside-diphosphate-sugar epimerase